MKNFVFKVGFRRQFRAEMFNGFNTPDFGRRGASVGSGQFGGTNSASAAQVVQVGLKLYF